jgi:2-methylcitrate dehydratase PrpD
VIDGCIQLREAHALTPDMIDLIDLAIHPVVMELTANRAPRTGLEGKFSVYYAAAIGIVAGRAGEPQFSDDLVADPILCALRDRVETTADPALAQDQARVTIKLRDGRVFDRFVEHAVGSVENPMTDARLDAKFLELATGILPDERTRHLMALCRGAEQLEDAGDIARAAAAH